MLQSLKYTNKPWYIWDSVIRWQYQGRRNVFSTKIWTSKDVRQGFIEYFKSRDHLYVHSSSVIPNKKEGVYFINAGMNQFKPRFLGTADPNSDMARYKRVVNSQKCIRIGGKHNDLDDVGKDTTHHTFFEMLGSWSFGDYFKTDACKMAWELLTHVYGLPKERLYVSYFGGDAAASLTPDYESHRIWRDIGVPDGHILPFGVADNFWDMGDTGPCGPCTEIHFDHIGDRDAAPLVNTGDPSVTELWNLVFTQYDRQVDSSLKSLPSKHVDTGMGLERLTAILQGKLSNYDTDLFAPIFEKIHVLTGVPQYRGCFGSDDYNGIDTAYRTVADHTRMFSVAIADGLRPGRKDLDSKLRMVIHRCLPLVHKTLGGRQGMLGNLVPVVVESLGEAFPELAANPKLIMDVVDQTEDHYLKTVETGQKMMTKAVKFYNSTNHLTGQQLYEIQEGRFGKPVPIDIICSIADSLGIHPDMDEFETVFQQQQVKHASALVQDDKEELLLNQHDVDYLTHSGIGQTDDSFKYTTTLNESSLTACIRAIKHGQRFVEHVSQGNRCSLVLDKTIFYAEAGGQAADNGTTQSEVGSLSVDDVQNVQHYVAHIGTVSQGTLSVGQELKLVLSRKHRQGCMANHTATHIINFALNQVLGDVRQQGSIVNPDKLTFDFTAAKAKVRSEELAKISQTANTLIEQNLPVYKQEVALKEATKIQGLRMLANEAYPNTVRVVSVGTPVEDLLDTSGGAKTCSIELCGGTHVDHTGDLGALVITHLHGMNQGTKRIVAITGATAQQVLANADLIRQHLEELKLWVQKQTHQTQWVAKTQLLDKLLTGQEDMVLPKLDRDNFMLELIQLKARAVSRQKKISKLDDLTDLLSSATLDGIVNPVVIELTNKGISAKDVAYCFGILQPDRPVMVLFRMESWKKMKKLKLTQGQIGGVCYVPDDIQTKKGLTAKNWAQHVYNFTKGQSIGPAGEGSSAYKFLFNEDNKHSTVSHAKELATTFAVLYL